jgi:competence protein ComFC
LRDYSLNFRDVFRSIGEAFFPPDASCSICRGEKGMLKGIGICLDCYLNLIFKGKEDRAWELPFIAALHYDGEGAHMVRRLKYEGQRYLARTLAHLMADAFVQNGWEKPDVLIPVPLHIKRRRKRGYNQSELLCRELSPILNVPYDGNALVRVKNTRSQTGLNREDRIGNMDGAFTLRAGWNPAWLNILLVDDVCTTGATLCECAKVLAHYGARDVRALVAAHGG